MENQVKSTINEHVSHQNIHLFSRFFPIFSHDFPMKNLHFLRTFPIATHGKGSSRRTRCLNFLQGETPNIGGESN